MRSAEIATMPSSKLPSALASLMVASRVFAKYSNNSCWSLMVRPSNRFRKVPTPVVLLLLALEVACLCTSIPTVLSTCVPCSVKSTPLFILGATTPFIGSPPVDKSTYILRRARCPYLLSTSNSFRSTPAPSARRSPLSRAPRDWRRLAAALANRRSPPTGVTRMRYTGADTWLLRWERPNCWMALSADHGSSNVMCSRRRWFAARLSACKLMPVDAASEIIATNLSPFWKLSLSFMLTSFSGIPGQRRTYSTLPSSPCIWWRIRPVISATQSLPPHSSVKWSMGFGGNSSNGSAFSNSSLIFRSQGLLMSSVCAASWLQASFSSTSESGSTKAVALRLRAGRLEQAGGPEVPPPSKVGSVVGAESGSSSGPLSRMFTPFTLTVSALC
mmetsp:Transcript_42121/g.80583  ORF Transcript_42121/g.80583 Transcript_42121/m.80583 type:complete len:388 (+) Transcript_42121:1225-2388(+)